VGEALLELHRDSPSEVYGLLARHFTAADDPQRAAEYLLKAGDAARAVYAEDEAIELYRQALGFMERTGEEGVRETLLKIALTHHLAFNYAAANEAFGQAFARPAPEPARLEPSERITWALAAAGYMAVAPGHVDSPQGLDSARNLFRGLVALRRDFEIEPDLAERFTVSDDGRSYTFTLRSDALWSDGVRVTADDFEFTYARMAEDDVDTAYWLAGVSANAVDERTLEIQLREPRNHFLYVLAQPPLFAWPRHVYERDGRDWHRAVPLVGNGPFVLRSREEGRDVIAAAPAWNGARGNVYEVTLELEVSAAVAADRWRRGEYDLIDEALAFRPLPTRGPSCSARRRCSRGFLASTRNGRRSTTPVSAAPWRMRSTVTGRRSRWEEPRPRRAGWFRRPCRATRTGSRLHLTRIVSAYSWARRATPTEAASARSCWRISICGRKLRLTWPHNSPPSVFGFGFYPLPTTAISTSRS
jgi:hypothetical protein